MQKGIEGNSTADTILCLLNSQDYLGIDSETSSGCFLLEETNELKHVFNKVILNIIELTKYSS